MAKKNKNKDKDLEKKVYKNPSDTIWGKVLIWLILIGMIGGAVFGLIVAIIDLL